MRFEVRLALRHLLAGGWQTVLIIAGVAMAVTLVIFISGLIFGLQRRIVTTIIGTIPQVTISPPEPAPRVLAPPGGAVVARVEPRAIQRRTIDQWQTVAATVSRLPHVRAVSPEVSGQAIVTRGSKELGVPVIGADPEERNLITRLTDNLIVGHYLGLAMDEVVISLQQANDLGVWLHDRVSLTASTGQIQTFRIGGIVDTGGFQSTATPVYITLRAAQALFGRGNDVTTISLTLDDSFQADAVADQIAGIFGLKTESWMRNNPQVLSAFRAQSATAFLISAFSLVAAGFAIASVLIVSVLKRSREIGILKAMGSRSRQVLLTFTLEGLGIAVIGAIVGAFGGSGLILAFRAIAQPVRFPGQRPEPLLPGIIDARVILMAMVAAIIVTVIASALPARQAARLDPVTVIRG
jgi:lipoprotein-releasing system permease protein